MQTKQRPPSSQLQHNAQTREQASPKEQTACQKYEELEKMWKSEKEELEGWKKNLRPYTECLKEEWHQAQLLRSLKKDKSKTLPFQTLLDVQ